MVLPVYIYGHPVLRAPNRDVTPDFPNLAQTIQNMKDTMYATDGIGIAAPQVGINARIVYIDVDQLSKDMPELKDVRLTLINPEITVDETGKTTTREEGCLSIPGIHENVDRYEKIHIEYLDENFQPHQADIEGFLARVIQHECDHLQQTLFVDRISPIRKQLVRARLANMAKGKVNCDYRVVTAPRHPKPKK